ncbi:MAG TPA: thiamine phosphate synthase [Caulobacteraceae bacterium]|nr:thiamine phosphate synthase [Caulobacteraceae bacterium]
MLFFTDPARTPDPARTVARLPRGAAVVFRAFGASDAIAQGRRMKAAGAGRGVMLIVGADRTLASALGAQGLHVPERLAARKGVIGAARRRFLVTASAHDWPALLVAKRSKVDAAIVGPVFPSSSASAGRPLGSRRLAAWARAIRLPVYALGGVNVSTTKGLGACGLAGIAAVESLTV